MGDKDMCLEDGCPAGVSVCLSDNTMTHFKRAHTLHGNHEAKKEQFGAIKSIRTKCLDVGELFSNQISTKAVFDREVVQNPEAMVNVHYSKLARSLRRYKESIFPQSPPTIEKLDDAFRQHHIRKVFGETNSGKQFFHGTITGEGYSCAIFTSPEIIELIEQQIPPHDRTYLADATFKIVPVGFFTQLLIIYIAYEQNVFPFCYVLMSKKSEIAYKHVFKYIDQKVFQMSPTKMIMDFERAMRKAFLSVHPDSIVLGCWFHHNQAVRRRASKIQGFFAAIYATPEYEQAYKKFMKLPLLPYKDIVPAFESIKAAIEAKTDVFQKFFEYYRRQWLDKVSISSVLSGA